MSRRSCRFVEPMVMNKACSHRMFALHVDLGIQKGMLMRSVYPLNTEAKSTGSVYRYPRFPSGGCCKAGNKKIRSLGLHTWANKRGVFVIAISMQSMYHLE